MDTKYIDSNIDKDHVVSALVDRTLYAWKALVGALALLRVDPDNHEATFLVTRSLTLLILGIELIGIPQLLLILPSSHRIAFLGCILAFVNAGHKDEGGLTYENIKRRLLTKVEELPAVGTCCQEVDEAMAQYVEDIGDLYLLKSADGPEC